MTNPRSGNQPNCARPSFDEDQFVLAEFRRKFVSQKRSYDSSANDGYLLADQE